MPAMPGFPRAPGRLAAPPKLQRYWRLYVREAPRPLHALAFLLPLVVLHQVGLALIPPLLPSPDPPLAERAIRELFAWFGLARAWVAPVVLVAALLVWHRVRREPPRVYLRVLPGMLVESLVLAVPLLVIGALFSQERALSLMLGPRLIRGLGAGIYEELVFRLLLIAGLTWFFAEVVHLDRLAPWVAAGLAALLFAHSHFRPIGYEPFALSTYSFRLLAGLYLTAVFTGRGLGIAGGSHAAYNLLLIWLRG